MVTILVVSVQVLLLYRFALVWSIFQQDNEMGTFVSRNRPNHIVTWNGKPTTTKSNYDTNIEYINIVLCRQQRNIFILGVTDARKDEKVVTKARRMQESHENDPNHIVTWNGNPTTTKSN